MKYTGEPITLYRATFYPSTSLWTIDTASAAGVNESSVWTVNNGKKKTFRRIKKNRGYFLSRDCAKAFLKRRLLEELEVNQVALRQLQKIRAVLETTYTALEGDNHG